MTADRPPLPDFDSPPVSEVALTVFFEPLNQLQTAHIGLLWQEFRARFPRVEDQPPLPPVIESFGVPSTFNLGIQIHVTASPGIPRSLFVDDQGAELIQFQNDRISHNWRRIVPASDLAPGPVDYPRYGQLRESFSRELDVLAAFLAREELGELNPIQCEITYVNEVAPISEDVGDILSIWSSADVDPLLRHPERLNLAVSYVIPDAVEKPLGRLHLETQKVIRRSDRKVVFLLTVTARGKPDGVGLDGVFRFLDLGHEWAVRGFTAVTSPALHSLWGRSDVS
jgi:uncharacterized protein (TIGR04255 family)